MVPRRAGVSFSDPAPAAGESGPPGMNQLLPRYIRGFGGLIGSEGPPEDSGGLGDQDDYDDDRQHDHDSDEDREGIGLGARQAHYKM